jgi:MFS family permease
MAIEYYLPLFFQSVLLSTPVRSGILLLPTILTEAVTGFISGIVIHRTGSYLTLLYVGTIFLVIGESLFALISVDSSLSAIVSFQVIAGFGTGFLFSPPLLGLQANVKQEQTATATSTMGLVRNLSTCLSVFVGGMIFQNGMESRWRNLIDTGLSPTSASAFTGSEAAANVILIAKITDSAQRMAVQKAFAQSLRGVWILCAGMAGCAVLCVGLVVKKVLTDTHVEARTGVASDMK